MQYPKMSSLTQLRHPILRLQSQVTLDVVTQNECG